MCPTVTLTLLLIGRGSQNYRERFLRKRNDLVHELDWEVCEWVGNRGPVGARLGLFMLVGPTCATLAAWTDRLPQNDPRVPGRFLLVVIAVLLGRKTTVSAERRLLSARLSLPFLCCSTC